MKALYGFISTGNKVAMYTLRIMYRVPVITSGTTRIILRDYFVQNLSNDKDTAVSKAMSILDAEGLQLKGDPSFDLNEIKRIRSEEKEEIKRAAREYEEKQARAAEEVFERESQSDVFLSGKYTGMLLSDVFDRDPQYILWLAKQEVSELIFKSKFDVMITQAKLFVEKNEIEEPGFVGTEGEKIEVELKLVSAFNIQGQFPSICWNCVTDNHEAVKFYSTAKGFRELKDGQKFKVTATVKYHSESGSKKVTILNRPKIVK